MKIKSLCLRVSVFTVFVFVNVTVATAQKKDNSWRRVLNTKDSTFFTTAEARRIGDEVLDFQRVTGGWPKNINMVTPLTPEHRSQVLNDKSKTYDSTTDNGATNMQMNFLARLYKATGDTRYRDAFRHGVEYLLSGQYPNGGWPQFWPNPQGYQVHITYNDDAMINTLTMFQNLLRDNAPYTGDLVAKDMKKRMQKAINKAVDIILKTQIVTDGKPTVWCQQHDRVTLKPAPARAYELPSYCSSESAAIVAFLMSLEKPTKQVIASVNGAMTWFDKYKITNYRVTKTFYNGKPNTELVVDSTALPIWARYYDLDKCEPYVCDRDGLPRRSLSQIGEERRNGYSWYNNRPAGLYVLYNKWADKYEPKTKVALHYNGPGANETGLIQMFRQPNKDEKWYDAVVRRGESIQAALDRAPSDATLDNTYKIYIKKGVYPEKVIIDKPNIMLIGENRDSCIIVGAETSFHMMKKVYNGQPVHQGIVVLTSSANDCILSGLTVINNYGTTVNPTTTHQMSVYGNATRTIITNCNINSDGNDDLSLWCKDNGMYYHADLYLACRGVDFICPRGTCYATRCTFYGDGRAIIWHDASTDKDAKFVITNSKFDGRQPTVLGRFHHENQFYIVNCEMTDNILDKPITHAYGHANPPGRVYYYGCHRDGGDSGWLRDNLKDAPGSPEFHAITAKWTFNGRWDPEARIRSLWKYMAY